MKEWLRVDTWLTKFKQLNRQQIEKIAYILIIASFLLVWVQRIPQTGKLTLDQGKMVYQGSILNGKMNGKGTLTFENGDTYTGEFKNGAFDGQGTFTSKDGWTYVGEFKKGLADGKGKLTTENKTIYEGQFKQGIYQDAD